MRKDIDLVSSAIKWLGTPWKHNQKKKDLGVDCVNFLSEVAKDAGLDIPLIPSSYGRVAVGNQIEDYLNANFKKVRSTDIIKRNDILLYNFYGYCNHVAVAVDSCTIIHASYKEGKVVQHNIDGVWRRRIKGIWRY